MALIDIFLRDPLPLVYLALRKDGTLIRSQIYDPPFTPADEVITDVQTQIDHATLTAFLDL